MLSLILPLLSQVVPDVLKRILPAEKMSEVEQAQLAQSLTLELAKQDWQAVEAEYQDRANARALAGNEIAKGNALTAFLAATVRPVWGLGAFILYAGAVVKGWTIPGNVASAAELVIMFYFGGRTVEKIAPTVLRAVKK